MGKMQCFATVHLSHFLQADDVCVKLLNRMAKIVNFQPPRRPNALNAFVDVVGRYTQECHGAPVS
jgi:hypothetical protein